MKELDFGIIAAGEGSRLKESGIESSKPMLTLNGVPLIERQLRIAERYGFSSVSCIINEESPDLEEYLNSRKNRLPFNLIRKSTPSSMHSLLELGKYLDKRPFFLTTVDTIFNEQTFASFVDVIRKDEENDGILGVTGFVNDEKPLCVRTDDNLRITGFDDVYEDHKYITAGFYYFSNSIFNEKDAALNKGIERLRNFLRHLIQAGYILKAYPFGKVIDVDTPEDIKIAEKFLNEAG